MAWVGICGLFCSKKLTIMKISNLEKEQLLLLYKNETGNSMHHKSFNLSDYLEWLENKVIELLKSKE
jgi:hypothetical protein